MAAGILDLYIEQGATFYRKITLDDGATPTPNKINLTGFTFEGKIRKTIDAATSIVSFTCTVLNQGTNLGEFTLSLNPTQTSAITLKGQKVQERVTEPFAYDVEMTYPSGKKERILQGIVNVSPEVTR